MGLLDTSLPDVHAYLNLKLEECSKSSGMLAVIMLKFISLKDVNTAFGYQAGDQFLEECANRIRQALLSTDDLLRTGDSEFMVCLTDIRNEGQAILAANKILKIMEQPVIINQERLMAKIALGIALYPEHSNDAEELLRKADTAMLSAIKRKQPFRISTDYIEYRQKSDLVLETQLKDAIEHNALSVHYQPIFDVKSNTIVCLEALARWDNPSFGNIPPDIFITIAENTNLIENLTLYILNTAIKETLEWADSPFDIRLSVNLSTVCLNDPDIVPLINRAVNIWGIDPDKLVLEVTESAMMDNPEHSLQILKNLRRLNIHTSIDDFGTGYSSFAYLKRLPVSELKIDKSFVVNMSDNDEDELIVRSVINLAHNFNLHVTAEGVENQETMDQLDNMGCDNVQGYYLAKPMPRTTLKDWIRDHSQPNPGPEESDDDQHSD